MILRCVGLISRHHFETCVKLPQISMMICAAINLKQVCVASLGKSLSSYVVDGNDSPQVVL
jgi:hypothetical protein